jgi:hypothetical protein
MDLVVPFLAGLAALAAHPEAGHSPPLASEGVCPLLDPQIAPPAGKTKPRCCDSRFDSANEPGQFLVASGKEHKYEQVYRGRSENGPSPVSRRTSETGPKLG